MTAPPSQEEILAEFQAVLDRFRGPISIENELPDKVQCQQQGIWLQFLGVIKGWSVFVKKNAMGVAIAICLYGDFRQGVSTIVSDGKIVYDTISQVVEYGQKHLELPATDFAMVDPPANWPVSPKGKINVFLAMPNPTTTTPPPSSTVIGELLPGSGLVPRSQSWRYYG